MGKAWVPGQSRKSTTHCFFVFVLSPRSAQLPVLATSKGQDQGKGGSRAGARFVVMVPAKSKSTVSEQFWKRRDPLWTRLGGTGQIL